jgi:hypothetical protein
MFGCKVIRMTTHAPTKRPRWPSDVSVGFLIASLGALVLGVGFLGWMPTRPLMGIGAAIFCFGAAAGLFGGFGHFNRR